MLHDGERHERGEEREADGIEGDASGANARPTSAAVTTVEPVMTTGNRTLTGPLVKKLLRYRRWLGKNWSLRIGTPRKRLSFALSRIAQSTANVQTPIWFAPSQVTATTATPEPTSASSW